MAQWSSCSRSISTAAWGPRSGAGLGTLTGRLRGGEKSRVKSSMFQIPSGVPTVTSAPPLEPPTFRPVQNPPSPETVLSARELGRFCFVLFFFSVRGQIVNILGSRAIWSPLQLLSSVLVVQKQLDNI